MVAMIFFITELPPYIISSEAAGLPVHIYCITLFPIWQHLTPRTVCGTIEAERGVATSGQPLSDEDFLNMLRKPSLGRVAVFAFLYNDRDRKGPNM